MKWIYKIRLLILFLSGFFDLSVNGQQITKPLSSIPFFYEKVYLHTDRDQYAAGEDIWFKAYLVNAQNNKPLDYSKNLYAELISPELKIIASHLIRLENGLGNGDFKLPDTLSAGTYRLRAYTNWMRNFDDNFIFEKNIIIVNTTGDVATALPVQKPVKRFKKKLNPQIKSDTLPPGPLVRFFPEGGKMINDVQSLIAVKAEDEWGRGIPATGQIIATSGRTVAKFTCDSLGMGAFMLEPDESQSYHAAVIIKEAPIVFKLPNAWNRGIVLSVNTANNDIVAQVSCNGLTISELGGSGLVLLVKHGEKTFDKEHLTIKAKNMLVLIPDANLPEGIACITLYNDYGKPLCERLLYIHHPDSLQLKVITDKPVYQPKERVTVKIKINAKEKANLSLAAVDAAIVPVQQENIVSYLQLRSEIKGDIEHAERYFDTTNVNRFKQFDMLLLTQGWRDFIWKNLEKPPLRINYDIEQGIAITGRVRHYFNNKPIPNINITMFAPKAATAKLFTTVTDSSGRFSIDGAILYGYQFVNFTARTGRGKSGGWLQVDSLPGYRMPVKQADVTLHDTAALKHQPLIEREKERLRFSFTGNNKLEDVQIKGYSDMLPPEVHLITLAEQKDYGSVFQYLMYLIPGSHVKDELCSDSSGPFPNIVTGFRTTELPVYYHGVYADHSKIDYSRVCFNDYLSQPMGKVLKITINGRHTVDGIQYSAELVLKPGALDTKNIFDNAMADFSGYYNARIFYAPKYETPDMRPDLRTTIHWQPNITTDDNGETTVTYYNAGPKGNVRIIVEGITANGAPVAATVVYHVK